MKSRFRAEMGGGGDKNDRRWAIEAEHWELTAV